jgi:DNA primase
VITRETIEQIQNRIDIIDIVGQFVKLKKRGTNYLGNCPFHNERTPSFTVSPTKEIYKCFGCGKSGNAIGFLMEHEKYSYVEALRWLAGRYNIDIIETETSPEQKAQQLTADSLFIINHFARDFFRQAMADTDEGRQIGYAYLKERGFTPEIIERFELGYNPAASSAFSDTAIRAGYNKDLLLKTGIVVERDERLVDNYRERIIFPIHNLSGKVIGFGARIIRSNDRSPKYINTKENEIYVKSRILYGLYQARQAIDKNNECLLVEGYTDVISLHQAGIEQVVASGGTSLTQEQLRLIRKYTNNMTIVYDGDMAGIKAALRGLDMAVEEGLQVKLVLIPDKEDPDSYVRKVGKDAFLQFIQREKKDFVLFQLEAILAETGDEQEKKGRAVRQIAETISRMNRAEDFVKKQDYIRSVASMLHIDEAGLNNLINQLTRERLQKEYNREANNTPLPKATDLNPEATTELPTTDLLLQKDYQQEKALLRCLLEFGQRTWTDDEPIATIIFQQFDEWELAELIDDPNILSVFMLYREAHRNGENPEARQFLYHANPSVSETCIQALVEEPEISPNWQAIYESPIPNRDQLYREVTQSTLVYFKLRKVRKMIRTNQEELSQPLDDNQQRINIETHQVLKKMEADLLKQIGTVIYK